MTKQHKVFFLISTLFLGGCNLEIEDINDIDGPADIPFSKSLQKELGYTPEVISQLQTCHIQHSDSSYEEQREKNACACKALKGRVPKVYNMYCSEGYVLLESNASGLKQPLTKDL